MLVIRSPLLRVIQRKKRHLSAVAWTQETWHLVPKADGCRWLRIGHCMWLSSESNKEDANAQVVRWQSSLKSDVLIQWKETMQEVGLAYDYYFHRNSWNLSQALAISLVKSTMTTVKWNASWTQSLSLQIARTMILHKPCLENLTRLLLKRFSMTFVSWRSTKASASTWRQKATQRSVSEGEDWL